MGKITVKELKSALNCYDDDEEIRFFVNGDKIKHTIDEKGMDIYVEFIPHLAPKFHKIDGFPEPKIYLYLEQNYW